MKISVDELKTKGEIELEYISDEITKYEDVKPIDKTVVKVKVSLTGNEISIRGKMNCNVMFECDRCLSNFRKDMEIGISFMLDIDEVKEIVDIDSNLRDLFVSSIPIKRLCNKGCKGLCPGCGVNLNYEMCKCKTEKVDPRWRQLLDLKKRVFKSKMGNNVDE